MIIECVNCGKKFNVSSELIPQEGRTIQCGSCNHVWFFNYNQDFNFPKNDEIDKKKEKIQEVNQIKQNEIKSKLKQNQLKNQHDNKSYKSQKALVKFKKTNNLTFTKLLGFLIVLLVSFIAIIIVLDTFQNQLTIFFPNLELILFSFYETLIDVKLFIGDLVSS